MKSIRILSLAFCLCASSFAQASEWPAGKPIKLVVPFPAGGGADIIARTISNKLSENIGQKIIIENRAGAGGSLGTEAALRENVGYNAQEDIEPVAKLTEITLVMAVNPKRIPVKNLKDFLQYARSNSKPLTYSSAGNGTTSHLAGVLLSQMTELPFEHIPYRGGAASMTDMLAGRIDFTIDVAPNVLSHVKAQRLTALGLGSPSSDLSSTIKPISEEGVSGYELFAWDGIAVKKGTPEAIVKKLDQEIQKTLTVQQLCQAFSDAREDPSIGVIILTGAGPLAFCSGGDQKVRGNGGYVGGDGVPRLNVLDFQRMIRTCPKPVIAMVAGYAIGGGHVLHMLCDLTIAADNARFGQTGPRVGSFDGGWGASYMARLIGQKRAREMWFLCRQYDAQQALQMGLVNTVVPLEELEIETVKWCKEILANSPIAIRCLKAALNADCDGQAGVQELAGNATLLYYMTEEGKEGKNAFLEKRRPDFSKFPRLP